MSSHSVMDDGWASNSANGSCVEVRIAPDAVEVRHSQEPDGPRLTFTHAEWEVFLAGVRLGRFDAPASV